MLTAEDIPRVVGEITERGGRPVLLLPALDTFEGLAGERMIGGVWAKVRLSDHVANDAAYVIDEAVFDDLKWLGAGTGLGLTPTKPQHLTHTGVGDDGGVPDGRAPEATGE